MEYISTRGNSPAVKSAEAISLGMVPRGGLFVPDSLPVLESLDPLAALDYRGLSMEILKLFLTGSEKDYEPDELRSYVENAYNPDKFDHPDIAPLIRLDHQTAALELWHGPTAAFKDMALQIMPYFLTGGIKKLGKRTETVILVATSGDTGKAALEGYRDVPGTRIVVFYPKGGVSRVQELQMLTTAGSNTHVAGVEGNFDDCQNMVKSIFGDPQFNRLLFLKGYELSSANSINWGRLVPQIIYYFWAYFSMARAGMIAVGDKAAAVVPTGNFGNILAAYYARGMGLPLERLVCASNRNNVLTDFIATGVYDRRRKFYHTSSPSMDILISSNLERFLFELANHSAIKITRWYEELARKGEFKVDDTTRQRLHGVLHGGYADEDQTRSAIRNVSERYHYLIDPHTAVGFHVLDQFRVTSGPLASLPAVVCSTASPYKFDRCVYESLTGDKSLTDEIAISRKLSELTGTPVHRAVSGIAELPVRHDRVIGVSDGRKYLKDILGIA